MKPFVISVWDRHVSRYNTKRCAVYRDHQLIRLVAV